MKRRVTPPLALSVPFVLERPKPPFEGDDIKYPEGLVRACLDLFTKRGDRVFDPFAGLGTTLFVAEETGRIPYGIEADPRRHAWVAGQMEHWLHLIHGDAAKMARYGLPKMDFCMTSPPYMPRHHQWNPLFAGNPAHAGYAAYLKQMGRIFASVAQVMKKGAYVAVQADNLHHGRLYTPLVADLQTTIAKVLTPAGDMVVTWQNPRPDYPHTHVLLFRA